MCWAQTPLDPICGQGGGGRGASALPRKELKKIVFQETESQELSLSSFFGLALEAKANRVHLKRVLSKKLRNWGKAIRSGSEKELVLLDL